MSMRNNQMQKQDTNSKNKQQKKKLGQGQTAAVIGKKYTQFCFDKN